ncbi:MAG: hypothetical protein HY774_04565 [Acidobacteria bacterium]|nr:hypothetical protein [Acidobacteriota bacterium]
MRRQVYSVTTPSAFESNSIRRAETPGDGAIELESDWLPASRSLTSWIDGKGVVTLDEARSGIHRHRTLASGLKAISGPCAVGSGLVDLSQMQQRELGSQTGPPPTGRASRATPGKGNLEPSAPSRNGSGCPEQGESPTSTA